LSPFLEVLGEHDRLAFTGAFEPFCSEPMAELAILVRQHRVRRVENECVTEDILRLKFPNEATRRAARDEFTPLEIRQVGPEIVCARLARNKSLETPSPERRTEDAGRAKHVSERRGKLFEARLHHR